MLGYWRFHSEFKNWLVFKLKSLISKYKSQISYYANLIEKVYVIIYEGGGVVKSNKNLIIILSCLVVVGGIFFAWQNISNRDVFIISKDGKWKIGYVKNEKSFASKNKYYCILTYQGKNPDNIENLSFEYYHKGANSPASYGKYTKKEIKFPLVFGLFSEKLKRGEERIVKLEWKENGKVYKEDLIIKR